tara:strand:- start:7104 stop:7943 length:840 start_codon:yes stop_codon:yes gene_type:complete
MNSKTAGSHGSNEVMGFAHELADIADGILLSQFGTSSSTGQKESGEIVTRTDQELHDALTRAIGARYCLHHILSEESESHDRESVNFSGDVWVIDPLDGTANFARGHDAFASSIAFARGGVLQCAVVTAPQRKERFSALKGQGAFLNGERIQVSGAKDLRQAVIATGFPQVRPSSSLERLTSDLKVVLGAAYDIRRSGSPCLDLCCVACGRVDGFYEALTPWDFAAGILISEEAGAATSGEVGGSVRINGPDKQKVIAATPGIFQVLQRTLTENAFSGS